MQPYLTGTASAERAKDRSLLKDVVIVRLIS